MKFLDLYNRNKNTAVFKEKQRIFKAYTRLAKNLPKEYKVKYSERNGCFLYYHFKYVPAKYPVAAHKEWVLEQTSLLGYGKYKCMVDFEK
jgi:hypothetical protein